MKRVLVISPHPDDESIGCGGTLRKHVVEGDVVQVIFLTSGEQGGHGAPPELTAVRREAEAKAAAEILGVHGIEFFREPDGKLSATPNVVERLRGRIQSEHPDLIYLPHDREMHCDHCAAVEIVRRALETSLAALEILMYEVWTPLQRMDAIVDISPFIEVKRSAIRAYQSQCAEVDFEQAILGLNRYRGEMHSWPGGDYAEVFARLKDGS
jgi:LmbE family N-acetylglucosaminyl deacetylase